MSSAAQDAYESPEPRGDLVRSAGELTSKRPDINALLSHLEFEPLGHSAYLWPEKPSPLRGVRVGPFWLLARPKGTTGPANLRVVIQTRKLYLDPNGKQLPGLKGASAIQQTVESIQIIPLEPPDTSLLGTWRLVSTGGPLGIMLSSAKWTFGSNRRFKAVEVSAEGRTSELQGYYLNDQRKLTLGQIDSGTFQYYDYVADGKLLTTSLRDESGKLVLEWTFNRE